MKNEENENLIDEVKKYFDEKTEETKRHFDVAVEEFKSEIKIFGEQLSDVSQKVDGLTEKVDSLVEDMDYVKSNLVDKTDRFKEIDAVTDNHEKRLVKLENAALTEA